MPTAANVLVLLRIAGLLVLLLSAGSLLLAWKNQLKPLIATGALSLAILTLLFIKLQALFAGVPGEFRAVVGIGWGFFAMVAAAILLIIAGVKREKGPADWNSHPPLNYR